MTETWRPVRGSNAKVSDLGRVMNRYGKLTRCAPDGSGYPYMWVSSEIGMRAVHRVVAETFIGECPTGFQVNHIDGNKKNNRVENLEYVSQIDNIRHAHKTGLSSNKGDRSNARVLSSVDSARIRQLRSRGWLLRELAARYGVHLSTIGKITTGVNWR